MAKFSFAMMTEDVSEVSRYTGFWEGWSGFGELWFWEQFSGVPRRGGGTAVKSE